jgi:hypothetical protein
MGEPKTDSPIVAPAKNQGDALPVRTYFSALFALI